MGTYCLLRDVLGITLDAGIFRNLCSYPLEELGSYQKGRVYGIQNLAPRHTVNECLGSGASTFVPEK